MQQTWRFVPIRWPQEIVIADGFSFFLPVGGSLKSMLAQLAQWIRKYGFMHEESKERINSLSITCKGWNDTIHFTEWDNKLTWSLLSSRDTRKCPLWWSRAHHTHTTWSKFSIFFPIRFSGHHLYQIENTFTTHHFYQSDHQRQCIELYSRMDWVYHTPYNGNQF